MNAHLRLRQEGPYEPIERDSIDAIANGHFTVLQGIVDGPKAKLLHARREEVAAMGGRVTFPLWVQVGFVVGCISFLTAFFSSVALFLFGTDILYWLTLTTLAVGVTAIAVSLAGAKNNVVRAGSSRIRSEESARRAEVRSA